MMQGDVADNAVKKVDGVPPRFCRDEAVQTRQVVRGELFLCGAQQFQCGVLVFARFRLPAGINGLPIHAFTRGSLEMRLERCFELRFGDAEKRKAVFHVRLHLHSAHRVGKWREQAGEGRVVGYRVHNCAATAVIPCRKRR